MNNIVKKIKYQLAELNNINIVIIVLLLFNLLVGISDYSDIEGTSITFLESMIGRYSNIYYIMAIFLILIFNSLAILKNSDKDYQRILRYSCKDKCLNKLINTIIINDSIVFFLNLIISIIFSLAFFNSVFTNTNNLYSNINIFIYFIFFYCRYTLIFILLNIIIILISKIFDEKVGVIFSVFILLIIWLFPYDYSINSLLELSLIPSSYLVIIKYPNFMMEVCCSSIYLLILILIVLGLVNILKNLKKDISDV